VTDEGFSRAQAARLSGCSTQQLVAWDRGDLVTPSGPAGTYTFRDLVVLRVVQSLHDAGTSRARVRSALRALAAWGDDLASLRLVADGRTVWACGDDGQVLDALGHGQLALFVPVERIVGELDTEVQAFTHDRAHFDELLRDGAITSG
jgi:DNA-binding transcriptional MerR regulator